jgi:uncharacterized protein (TIGR03435 family)
MKRRENATQMLGRFLERHFSPSNEQVEAAGGRVLQRLHADDTGTSECAAIEQDWIRPQRNGWRRAVAFVAPATVLVVVSVIVWRPNRPAVVATSVNGKEYGAGQPFRSTDGQSTVLALADGSRVEIRAGSEAAVERAADGLRVRLNAGSIIVNAAKQAAGRHLYVSTRDVLVSVVGTVFLVKADEQGSQVAVIEGEVHVKQGAMEKNLHRGEQASSRPKSETLAIELEIGWSREAAAYLAMLHQEITQSLAARQAAPPAAAVPAEVPQGAPKTPQFEEASVRPCPKDFQTPEGLRGGGSNSMRLSPGRLDALCMTVATLIRTAYRPLNNNDVFPGMREPTLRMNLTAGLGMENGTRVRGGPYWVRSEKYTIAAVAGSATDAHTLQNLMLMALLENRFQLKTHIETERIPIFALTIAKGGLKMKRAGRESCVQPSDFTGGRGYDPVERRRHYDSIRRGAKPECGTNIEIIGPNVVHIGGALPLSLLADQLSLASRDTIADVTNGLLIINKTGIPDTETFNYLLEYAADEDTRAKFGLPPDLDADVPRGPAVFEALEKQLGLKLERAQGSREYVVIDHIERPSPN